MKVIGFIACVAVSFAGAAAFAQTTPTSPEEGVERLLKRLDDIEKKRRQSEPARIAEAAGVLGNPPDSDPTGPGVGLALWALGVATAIFGIAVAVRSYRAQQPDLDPTKALEIEETMWIGRGQRLLLVRAREQELLIGASGGQLTSLAVLRAAEAPTSDRRPSVAEDDEAEPPHRKRDGKKFASLVQEELTNAAAGTAALNKQQILRRLNSL